MTFSGDNKGEFRTMMGVSPEEMVIAMKEAGAHVVGSNCGNGIEDMISITRAIRKTDNTIPVMIQANAGIPEYVDGKTVFRESPEMMASFIPDLIKAGASIIGGCCGTTPEHIRAMGRAMGKN
jgi:5-methyltetrahydrofolate--homocysteine methyltransferase